MDKTHGIAIHTRRLALAGRGPGEMAFIDMGDPDRPVDLIFAHANGFNARTYSSILSPLARRFRILAVDQRGHGSSSLDADHDDRDDWLDLRDDLLAFLEAQDLEGVILSGHSMGATASLLAAAEQPRRCRRLVLFDPVVPPPGFNAPPESPLIQGALRRRAVFPSRDAAMASYRGRGAFRTWPEESLRDYVEGGFRDQPDGTVTLCCTPQWEASGFSAHGHDPWEGLERSVCPIEILRAETGSTFQLERGSTLDRERITIRTIPGSTHFLPMEFPDLVRETLTRALSQPEAATA